MLLGEILIMVALGILFLVFLGSLVAFILVCYKRSNNLKRLFAEAELRPEADLITDGECPYDMELDDVRLAPQINKILNDPQWLDDATGLIPHCLAILKLCHQLTEKLLATTMASMHKSSLMEIIQLTQRLSPRIDDVSNAMYPPLDPRLLEARCSSLVLTLTLLAWHCRSATNCINSTTTAIIRESLNDMDHHLAFLKEAAMVHETYARIFSEVEKNDQAE